METENTFNIFLRRREFFYCAFILLMEIPLPIMGELSKPTIVSNSVGDHSVRFYNWSSSSISPFFGVTGEKGTTERDMSNDPLDPSIHPTMSSPLFRPVFTSIKMGERHSYSYVVNASTLSRWPAIQLQFYGETESTLPNATTSLEVEGLSLLVTVHWHSSIRSWEIPIHLINSTEKVVGKADRFSDLIVGKTLWDYPAKKPTRPWNLTVEFSIATDALVYYKLRIVSQKNFDVPVGGSVATRISPTSPSFFRFKTTQTSWEYFFIHVISESNACALMMVQQPRGPFLDQDESTLQLQYSETFTSKTGLTIPTSDFPEGLLVVFIPFENDAKCRSRIRFQNNTVEEINEPFRQKSLTFQIREAKAPIKFLAPMVLPVLVFFLVSVIVFTILFAFHYYKIRRVKPGEEKTVLLSRPSHCLQSTIMITDLITIEPSRVVDQTRRYCRAMPVTSAFYLVPVFQLILTFSKQLLETGNFDICYFNHFCSHTWGRLHDFNHMYSNIWYILFGILFICVVYVRQTIDGGSSSPGTSSSEKEGVVAIKKGSRNPLHRIFPRCETRSDRGVMMHFGLLYSMGYSLIMTGVMSAGYHICPNKSNFQFDTVFMYTIAAITVVNIYQSRHPVYLSANFTFTALALVTCITVLGLVWEELMIRVVFSLIHLLFLLLSVPKVCYNGYIRKDEVLVVHWWAVMKILWTKFKDDWRNNRICAFQRGIWRDPSDLTVTIIPGSGRLILPSFLMIINIGAIVAMWTFLKNENFATQVLFICVMNGSLYTIYYSTLKILHGECRSVLWIQPAIYLALSFFLWGFALYFFFDEVASWENSPAESRLKNCDCIFLGFYDTHDMWHFLSAASLFCSAMVLLTVDDDLINQPKSTIPVF